MRVTAVGTVTVLVVTANVFDVAPAGTVTEAGTVAALVLLLVSVTTAPPAWRSAAERYRARAARAARHGRWIDAYADQRRIQRQRGRSWTRHCMWP